VYLRNIGDALGNFFCRQAIYIFAVNQNIAPFRFDESQNRFQQSGFAGAIGAQKAKYLAGLNPKVNIFGDDAGIIAAGKIFDLNFHISICQTQDFFPFQRRKMKNGAPINEVSIPKGISAAKALRATLSIASKNKLPQIRETGKRIL
jgi:hypothetical protein